MMMSGMLALLEDCIAAAISFTSPRDACHLACISTTFKSAADSEAVWDRFLPPEYLSTISDRVPVSGSSSSTCSKKELYLRMGPTLIQNELLVRSSKWKEMLHDIGQGTHYCLGQW